MARYVNTVSVDARKLAQANNQTVDEGSDAETASSSEGEGDGSGDTAYSSDGGEEGNQGSNGAASSEQDSSFVWRIVEQPAEARSLCDQVLHTLVLREYCQASQGLEPLLQKVFAYDLHRAHAAADDELHTGGSGDAGRGHKQLLHFHNLLRLKQQLLASKALHSLGLCAIGDACSNSASFGSDSFRSALFRPLHECWLQSELRLRPRLAVARVEGRRSLLPFPSAAATSLNAQQSFSRGDRQDLSAPGLMYCEKLLHLLRKQSLFVSASNSNSAVLFKQVKLSGPSTNYQEASINNNSSSSSSSGGCSFLLSDCCEFAELLHTLNKYLSDLAQQYLLTAARPKVQGILCAQPSLSRVKSTESKYSGMLSDESDGSDDDVSMLAPRLSVPRNKEQEPEEWNEAAAHVSPPLASIPPEASDGTTADPATPTSPTRLFLKPPSSALAAPSEQRLGEALSRLRVHLRDHWHKGVSQLASNMDKFSTGLRTSQHSAGSAAAAAASSAVHAKEILNSIHREVLHTLLGLLRVLQVDLRSFAASPAPMSTGTGTGTGYSSTMAVAERIVECMLAWRQFEPIVKPSELAFGLPLTYYHFVDAWEGRVLYDHTTAGERCKIARHHYRAACSAASKAAGSQASSTAGDDSAELMSLSAASVSKAFASPYTKHVLLPLLQRSLQSSRATHAGKSSRFGPQSDAANKEREDDSLFFYLRLWEHVRAEQYMVQVISEATVTDDPQSHVTLPNASPLSYHIPSYALSEHIYAQERLFAFSSLSQSPYIATWEQYLHRNALFARLRLSCRYVAVLQVDMYHLKEIVATASTVKPPFSSASAGKQSNVASSNGLKYNTQAAAVLLPSNQVHAHSMEVFTIMRLSKSLAVDVLTEGAVASVPSSQSAAFFGSSNATAASKSNSSKLPTDCSFLSPTRRIEANRALCGAQGAGSMVGNSYPVPNGPSSTGFLLQQVAQSADYEMRFQGLFRMPVPEMYASLADIGTHGSDANAGSSESSKGN